MRMDEISGLEPRSGKIVEASKDNSKINSYNNNCIQSAVFLMRKK